MELQGIRLVKAINLCPSDFQFRDGQPITERCLFVESIANDKVIVAKRKFPSGALYNIGLDSKGRFLSDRVFVRLVAHGLSTGDIYANKFVHVKNENVFTCHKTQSDAGKGINPVFLTNCESDLDIVQTKNGHYPE